MKKEELINYINEYIKMEDSVFLNLEQFISNILKNSVLNDSLKEEICKKLGGLKEHTKGHKQHIEDYIQKIKSREENEF